MLGIVVRAVGLSARRSIRTVSEEVRELLRGLPVILRIDIHNPAEAELVGDGVFRGHWTGREPSVTTANVELSCVVKGDWKILCARVGMLWRDNSNPPVIVDLNSALDWVPMTDDRHQELGRSTGKAAKPFGKVLWAEQECRRVYDDDGCFCGDFGHPR